MCKYVLVAIRGAFTRFKRKYFTHTIKYSIPSIAGGLYVGVVLEYLSVA